MMRNKQLTKSIDSDTEVVISGISGRYPNSRNVTEFEYNLYNKIDMCDDKPSRWSHYNLEIPKRSGKLHDLEKFDAKFFNIENKMAEIMSPQIRFLLEVAYEAIIDAGINPLSLESSKTGVFIGCSFNDTDINIFHKEHENWSLCVIGNCRNMFSNHISQALKLNGPSIYMDSSCSSGGTILHQAVRSIKFGECDAAIIGVASLTLCPNITNLFYNLGALSKDGYCRPFDIQSNGFTRSECISVMFIQKLKDAKRVHASIVHTKIRCEGYKIEGITHPSIVQQITMLTEFYNEIEINPSDVKYVELHGTATIVGDRIECKATADVFSKNRTNPLIIGSVKSNCGHGEASSLFNSITKVILGFKNNCISPNIHFTTPRHDIEEFRNNKLKVCDTKTNINGTLIACSSYGLGGSQFHGLLSKQINDTKIFLDDKIHYLVLWSGQTKSSVENLFHFIQSKPLNTGFIALLNNINSNEVPRYNYKAYGIFSEDIDGQSIKTIIENVNGFRKPRIILTCEVFNVSPFKTDIQLNNSWMLEKSIKESRHILEEIIQSQTLNKEFTCTISNIIKVIMKQLALIDVLKLVDVEVNYSKVNTMGEIYAAYASEILNKENILTIIYLFSQTISNNSISVMNDELFKIFHQIIPESTRIYPKYIPEFDCHAKVTQGEYLLRSLYDTKPGQKSSIMKNNYESISIKLSASNITLGPQIFDKSTTRSANYTYNDLDLLSLLGDLFIHGTNMNINKLYPNIKFPVPNDTPFISSFIKWDHIEDWHVSYFENSTCNTGLSVRYVEISLSGTCDFGFYSDHIVDGKCIIPTGGYIVLIWETYSMLNQKPYHICSIEIQDLRIFKPVVLIPNKKVMLKISIHLGTSNFEISENATNLVDGFIKKLNSRNTREIDLRNIKADLSKVSNLEFTLNEENVYKIMRLNGYEYNGLFKSISEVSVNKNSMHHDGKIKWSNNWVTYIDGMMQMCLLKYYSGLLVLPTKIHRIQIDAQKHLEIINRFNTNDNLHLINCKYSVNENEIISESVRILGVTTIPVLRHITRMNALLEAYKFIPYKSSDLINIDDAVYVIIQIWIENDSELRLKIVEIEDDELPLIETFERVLKKIPMILPEFLLLNPIENIDLTELDNCNIIIVTNGLMDHDLICKLKSYMNSSTLLISRENSYLDYNSFQCSKDFQIISIMKTRNEYLIILRIIQKLGTRSFITINNNVSKYNWLKKIKEKILGTETSQKIVIVAEQETESGIVGLMNCLRHEFPQRISCIFVDDENAPKFNPNHALYKHQLEQCLTTNIYRNGCWGTYRHLQLTKQSEKPVPRNTHCFVGILEPGNLFNICWYSGPITEYYSTDKRLVHVQYATLNFRDVLLATGKIKKESLNKNIMFGFEFAGVNKNGNKIIGICESQGMATHVIAHSKFTWNVPHEWCLKQAVTCPIIYITVLIAFFGFKPISANKSILIHAGSGGVGLAAIHVALYYGMRVFTTISSNAKKIFLLQQCPGLQERDIGNSRDCSFEQMIKLRTSGKGIDYVLNSLSDDKLIASIRCLKRGGVFLEIGKTDMNEDTKVGLKQFLRNISFYTIILENLFSAPIEFQDKVYKLFKSGIENGVIQPIALEEMDAENPDGTFRYMSSGKHKGKIILKIRDNLLDEYSCPIHVKPYVYFNPNSVIVIPGGLGGFGIELVNWMIIRGARKFILNSRSGVRNSFQAFRIKNWRETGCHIDINQDDFTTLEGCKTLLLKAQQLGPIEGIFNLAVILQDDTLQSQTTEKFIECFKPKSIATKYLDELSRQMCTNLKYFVVFSSTSCGRGNIGQINYGMTNSIMERIIEQRIIDGLAGKAIQWGPIADVGILAERLKYDGKLQISGYMQQTIISCISVLDELLTSNDAIVSSCVNVTKNLKVTRKDSLFDGVMSLIGNFNDKNILINSTLTEIGLDSIILIEIKTFMIQQFQQLKKHSDYFENL